MDGRCGTLRFLGGVEGCGERSIGIAFQRAMLASDIAQGAIDPSVEDQTQDLTSPRHHHVGLKKDIHYARCRKVLLKASVQTRRYARF